MGVPSPDGAALPLAFFSGGEQTRVSACVPKCIIWRALCSQPLAGICRIRRATRLSFAIALFFLIDCQSWRPAALQQVLMSTSACNSCASMPPPLFQLLSPQLFPCRGALKYLPLISLWTAVGGLGYLRFAGACASLCMQRSPCFDVQVNADPSWALWEHEQPALQASNSVSRIFFFQVF